MPQRPLKTYDLKSVYLIIGGYRIGGYGAEGGIEFEFGAPIGEPTIGADGAAVFSRNNDDSMTCRITVLETSKSYRDLATLMAAQREEAPIEALNFLMRDDINGDQVKDQYATFMERPAPSKAKKAGERVFVLFLPNAASTAQFGASIAV